MSQLPETLPLPATVLLVVSSVAVAAAAIRWILLLALDIKARTKQGESANGDAGSWRTNVMGALTHLTYAVTQLGSHNDELERELTGIKQLLSEQKFAISLLPTREDLNAIAEKNRYVVGSNIQGLYGELAAMRREFKEAK